MSTFDINSARGDLEKEFGNHGQIVVPAEAVPPILSVPVRNALTAWMYEINAADELAKVGLKARQRCLLSGPPGCGKTTLAHHISARLGVPMLVVQAHEIQSKYVGHSGENIGKLFRAVRRNRYGLALFFDEFDALAKTRETLGGQAADNERANITIALLQEIDRFDGLLFAATNVTKAIDAAIWRRFEMQIEIGYPGPTERFAIVKLCMAPFEVDDEVVELLAWALDGASPALIRLACEQAKRGLVLGDKMNLPTDLPSIMERFANGAGVADGQQEPRLWTETRSVLMKLAKAPWPPVLANASVQP